MPLLSFFIQVTAILTTCILSLLFSSHPRLRQNLDTEQELDLSVMSVHARILERSLPVAFELLRFDASLALSGSNGRRILDR